MGIRLRNNYLWLYLAILVAWLAELNIHPTPAISAGQVVRRMSIGPVVGPAVLTAVACRPQGTAMDATEEAETRPAA